MAQYSYQKVVSIFQDACSAHLNVNTFNYGSLDLLDATSQNVAYPYVFLRPMQSNGLQNNVRNLTFEMYALDVPKLSNENALDIMSLMEQTSYDIISYFNRGQYQQEIGIQLQSIIPALEAFQDRAYGWISNIQVITDGKWDYCQFPQA
jgi:hypothetical protein